MDREHGGGRRGLGRVEADLFPTCAGSYALWFTLAQPAEGHVGRLGWCVFPAGGYVYLGSALGPGGLRGRLGRHLRPVLRPHWHIDAFRAWAALSGVSYRCAPQRLECAWVGQLLAQGAEVAVRGFGASDCTAGCPAHLLRLPPGLPPEAGARMLGAAWVGG